MGDIPCRLEKQPGGHQPLEQAGALTAGNQPFAGFRIARVKAQDHVSSLSRHQTIFRAEAAAHKWNNPPGEVLQRPQIPRRFLALTQFGRQPVQPRRRFRRRDQTNRHRRREPDVRRGGVLERRRRIGRKFPAFVSAQFRQGRAGNRTQLAERADFSGQGEGILIFERGDHAGQKRCGSLGAGGDGAGALVTQHGKIRVIPRSKKPFQNGVVAHAGIRQSRKGVAPGFHYHDGRGSLAIGLIRLFVAARETVGSHRDQGRDSRRGVRPIHLQCMRGIACQPGCLQLANELRQ